MIFGHFMLHFFLGFLDARYSSNNSVDSVFETADSHMDGQIGRYFQLSPLGSETTASYNKVLEHR
jgi:hypothetical protein